MYTCPECGHSGDDFDDAHTEEYEVIVCPNCDWYGPADQASAEGGEQ